MSQIQISYFSRHFYAVNVILLSVLHFWTNFDTKKILFIFYDSFFKAMTFSECPEAVQEISDRLIHMSFPSVFTTWCDMKFECLCDNNCDTAISRKNTNSESSNQET